MEWNGADIPINTNSITLTSADHKKRNLAWIGGSSAAGALIGGLLGGGKGALIGAGAGGAAGVGTAAATGKRQVRVPAESHIDLPACAASCNMSATYSSKPDQIAGENLGPVRKLRRFGQIRRRSFLRLREKRADASQGIRKCLARVDGRSEF